MTLREMREEAGWTISDLARESGVSRPMVSMIEAGSREPSMDTLRAIATALGIQVSELVAILEGEAPASTEDSEGET